MKKMKLLSLMLVICMLFTACQSSEDKESAAINDSTGSENSNSNSDSGNSTENMVWFPKSAKGVDANGEVLATIETEFDDSKLVYKYIMHSGDEQRYYGFEAQYANDEVTKYYELRGDRTGEEENLRKIETVVEFNETENTLYMKEFNEETGDIKSYYQYVFEFDNEGKITKKTRTYHSFYYDDNNELVEREDNEVDVFKYEYLSDGYNVVYDYQPWEMNLASGEEAECTKRETDFIPYDNSKNSTKTITYHLSDGSLAALEQDEWYDVLCDNSQKTEYVYNNKGYMIEAYSHLADGTKKSVDLPWECEFTDIGNVKKFVGYDDEGNPETKGDFTYDENGNITNIVMEFDGEKLNVEIEWMLVPKCIDTVNQMIYGDDLYAISELVEDAIPETNTISLQDTYYTKEMLEKLK